MKFYKTTATSKLDERETFTTWQVSQGDAAASRAAGRKLGHRVETETLDIPTAKQGLLEWLNANEAMK